MLRRAFLLALPILAALTMLLLTARPVQHAYQPGAEGPPRHLPEGYVPEQLVEQFLWDAQYLPAPGTSIDCCTPNLRWDVSPGDLAVPEREIVDLQVPQVTLATWRSLSADLLDDDPTYGAVVDVIVKTADGDSTTLAVKLWDYGLLTPWGIFPYGDGWKPSQVAWQANNHASPREHNAVQEHRINSQDVDLQTSVIPYEQ